MTTKIVILGAGNLATHFTNALLKTKIQILQIYSRSIESAKSLAIPNKLSYTNNITEINPNADIYIFMLSDDGICETIKEFPIKSKILIHSAGSISMDIFKDKTTNYGVFYPYQTFSKNDELKFSDVPICIEASNKTTMESLRTLSNILGCTYFETNESDRKHIHLAAVFACNFMNHCIYLGEKILQDADIDTKLLTPLLEQSFKKIISKGAKTSQTGPALRMDKSVLKKHKEMLSHNKQQLNIYEILSTNINDTYNEIS